MIISAYAKLCSGSVGKWAFVHSTYKTGHRCRQRLSTFSGEIRETYREKEVDGIILLGKESDCDSKTIVQESLKAADTKGQAASILNAWMASCLLRQDAADRATSILREFDRLENVQPDIVTLCLAYAASKDDDLLERCRKLAKKLGGSKRRKELAAVKRREMTAASEQQELLHGILGPDFSVLHESDDLVVVNKPSGVACYHSKMTTLKKHRDVSLVDALNAVPLSSLNAEARGVVHRLDRGTSGCLVLAKNDATHAQLVADFYLRRVDKSYLAVVTGSPSESEGTIQLPVDGKPAFSQFNVVSRYGQDAAMLRVKTLTGRQHQVRKHCAMGIQCPILLDGTYGRETGAWIIASGIARGTDDRQRFFLHASELSIKSVDVRVEADVPKWWDSVIESLQDHNL